VETARPLLIVVGPTGAGKTDLSLDLAQLFDGEIVNCDSLQLYRRFDVGTAKPPMLARRGIPHYLIDALDPDQVFTAGEYVRHARPILEHIAERGKLPVVVGGTGFYLRALLEGLFSGPERDPALRIELAARESRRTGFLHRALLRFDPPAAARIHRNDSKKLIRALEVCLSARQPMTSLFATGRDPLTGFRVVKIGLDPPREALYARLDERCLRMWSGGLIDEVRSILASGVAASAKPFESIGYKQALGFVQDTLEEAAALQDMQIQTRRYAKRQMTWFRREASISWMRGFGDDPAIREAAIELVRSEMRTGQPLGAKG
jgi:tRNA dimethylallyltransferase